MEICEKCEKCVGRALKERDRSGRTVEDNVSFLDKDTFDNVGEW